MKILCLLVLASLMVSTCLGYSTLNSRNPSDIKKQITANDWNLYVLYFYDTYGGKIDTNLSTHLRDNILTRYGDQVYFGEVDVANRDNLELLDLVELYNENDYFRSQNNKPKDVPFVLLISHGYGWILQGDNIHSNIDSYMDAIISHAKKSQTVE